MNTTDLVHYPRLEVAQHERPSRPVPAPSRYELVADVRLGIVRARQCLIDQQRLDGSWAGVRIGGVASLVWQTLVDAWLQRERFDLAEQMSSTICSEQLGDGGWSLVPGGPFELDASVRAYFALKLLGQSANRPELCRARHAIRQHGGADACGSTTRMWLALLGQVDYDSCPQILPEWLLAPASGSLTRADENRLAALSVVWSCGRAARSSLPAERENSSSSSREIGQSRRMCFHNFPGRRSADSARAANDLAGCRSASARWSERISF